jgi:hypothetical protein
MAIGIFNGLSLSKRSGVATTGDGPVLTATTISPTQINLGWNVTTTEEDGFSLMRSDDEGVNYSEVANLTDVLTYPNTGLTGLTRYYYKIRSYIDSTITRTKPTIVSSTVEDAHPDRVILTFDRNLKTISVPATTDFTLSGKTITSVTLSGAVITITVSVAYAYGDSIQLTYTKPAIYMLRALVGAVAADSFTNHAVTNNIAGLLTLSSITVENAAPTHVVLNYGVNLNTGFISDTTDYTITDRTVTNVSVSGTNVTLTVNTAVLYGDTITCAYVKGANVIKGLDGKTAASFSATTITNNVAADADLTTYITGLITPLSSGQRKLLNNFIVAIKIGTSSTNLSDAFDTLYVLAGETAESSLRNLASRNYDCTPQNSPTFTALEGYTGDAASMYLDMNWIASTNGVRYTKDDCGFGVYNRYARIAAAKIALGAIGTSSANRFQLYPRTTNARACINTSGVSDRAVTSSIGFTCAYRSASNAVRVYRDKTYTDDTDASVGVPNKSSYILAYNNNGTAASYTDDQISLAYTGRNLSEAEHGALVDAFEAYMDANGKGVI